MTSARLSNKDRSTKMVVLGTGASWYCSVLLFNLDGSTKQLDYQWLYLRLLT